MLSCAGKLPASQSLGFVEQRSKTGRAKVDDRGQSVWEFTDDGGSNATVSTSRVLALGDELSLVQTGMHPAAPAAEAVQPKVEPPPVSGKPPRKPMSRQELQKLSEEIVRQRKLRELADTER
jgi:hypothetical protein